MGKVALSPWLPEVFRAAVAILAILLALASHLDIITILTVTTIILIARVETVLCTMMFVVGCSYLLHQKVDGDVHRMLAWLLFALVLVAFAFRRLIEAGEKSSWRAQLFAAASPWIGTIWGGATNVALIAALAELIPKGQAMRWFVIVSLLAWQASRSDKDQVPPRVAPLLFQYLFSLALFLLSLEIGARIAFGSVIENRHLVSHPVMGMALRPGFSGKLPLNASSDKWREYPISVSSIGLRDREYGPKAPNEYRILMLGDSYTMGVGVDETHMPSRQLEIQLAKRCPQRPVTVINAGVVGYGPWQELALLREIGLTLEPDVLIHQLYLTNDVHDEMRRAELVLDSYSEEQMYFWNTRRYANHWSVWADGALLRTSSAYEKLMWRTRGRYSLARLLTLFEPVGAFRVPILPIVNDELARDPWMEYALVERPASLEQSLQLIRESILTTQALCDGRGIAYLAYAQPNKRYVQGLPLPRGPKGEVYDPDADVKILEDFFEQAGIPYLPLGQLLREHPNGEDAFFENDSHLDESGNALLAELLSAHIVKISLACTREANACP